MSVWIRHCIKITEPIYIEYLRSVYGANYKFLHISYKFVCNFTPLKYNLPLLRIQGLHPKCFIFPSEMKNSPQITHSLVPPKDTRKKIVLIYLGRWTSWCHSCWRRTPGTCRRDCWRHPCNRRRQSHNFRPVETRKRINFYHIYIQRQPNRPNSWFHGFTN